MHDSASARGRPEHRRASDVMEVLLAIAPDPELDPEAAERVIRRLRSEISDLDVESLHAGSHAPAPDTAKGADAVTTGAIVVALSATGGVFTALIETVRDHLARSSARHRVSLTIDGDTLELERASATERRELIDAYIRRHAGS
ncbi:hypothetical protein [Streptomyces griseorubiginosus]|uniref:hypothetical protein n=1 Tax=Streptomyces griseorubiginosus TaxID=67304 RepID=UPI001AD67798|nr:hypothetical protein [Streptomyces griseorubiginosus]MBO4258694.1 hypothetical protein [Streptomyces griseorubiginosus]